MDSLFLKIKILPRWIIILIDLVFLSFASFLAYLLRFNFEYSRLDNFEVNKGVLLFALLGITASLFSKSYAGIVRYTGIQDAARILLTLTTAGMVMVVINQVNYYLYDYNLMPYSVLIIAYFSSIIFLITYRLGVKQLFQFFWSSEKRRYNVAIFGSDKSAEITRQIVESDLKGNRKVVAFLDDHRRKAGKVINGVTIYDGKKGFHKLIDSADIKELIIADRAISIDRKNELVDECLKFGIKVRMVPPVEHWVNGELRLNQIKDIDIEELLERDSIKLENYNVRRELKGKRVLITGAAGSIGSEIVRQVLYYRPSQIIMVDQSESGLFEIENEIILKKGTMKVKAIVADITRAERMEEIFFDTHPEVVFHSAAYKHVPMMEMNPSEAIHCNVLGTKILADLAVKHEAEKFVMISTDKAVNPSSVMGASKRIAEIYVQSLNNFIEKNNPDHTKFITTRFGNVLGSNGSVIPLFKKQIEQGGPLTVTHPDITRYFMTIPEACQLVLEASAMGKGGEIFVFDMGKSIKIVDLARKMVQLSGFELGKDIEIAFTGLRSGEKLYEELLSNLEDTLPTYHHKIMISKTRDDKFDEVKANIDNLIHVADDHDYMKLVGIMKYIVPEFISKSSRFEVLDKNKYIKARPDLGRDDSNIKKAT